MKQLCSQCAERPAKFLLSGRRGVRSQPNHDLCDKCHRSWRNKLRNIDGPDANVRDKQPRKWG